MRFEKKPSNDFEDFIRTYYRRCLDACPQITAIAGKWTFEDLIPGLSDFDSRLIFSNDVGVFDWPEISTKVGKVHTELAVEHPDWARKLEHNPGINLTPSEMVDPVLYNPESRLWTFYEGNDDVIRSFRQYLADKPWARRDEIFFLKKLATYYGPYQRGIDPPVNIGRWENKYPLHSRFMHYFTPPVQAAVALACKKAVRGKLAVLRKAREIFPNPRIIDMVLGAVENHYEIPEYYEEPKLSEIEAELQNYLHDAYVSLSNHVDLIKVGPNDTVGDIRAKVASIPVDAGERFCEGTRFGRLMKGRLHFYAAEIPWFDTTWLIPHELNRMVRNLVETPLKVFALAKWREKLMPEEVLSRLEGNVLDEQLCQHVGDFVNLASKEIPVSEQKQHAAEVAAHYDHVQIMIETLKEQLYKILACEGNDLNR